PAAGVDVVRGNIAQVVLEAVACDDFMDRRGHLSIERPKAREIQAGVLLLSGEFDESPGSGRIVVPWMQEVCLRNEGGERVWRVWGVGEECACGERCVGVSDWWSGGWGSAVIL